MLSEQQRQKYYHRQHDVSRYRARTENPYVVAKERDLLKQVVPFLPENDGIVLDVGCGEGATLKYLREVFAGSLIGMDFSQAKVAYAQGMQDTTMFAVSDALHLPFATASVDLVLMRDLLHHVDWARDSIIDEAFRVVRPGGWIVVIEADGTTLINRVFSLLYPVERGMRNSTETNIRALARSCAEVRFHRFEATFLLRAASFVLGWPSPRLQWLAHLMYRGLSLAEKILRRVIPRDRWTYMLLALRRE